MNCDILSRINSGTVCTHDPFLAVASWTLRDQNHFFHLNHIRGSTMLSTIMVSANA